MAVGNHDIVRAATRYDVDPRTLMLVLMTSRGAPVIFQGDELGAEQSVDINSIDPISIQGGHTTLSPRDGCRADMPWKDCSGEIPMICAPVIQQDKDPNSPLNFTRKVTALRRENPQWNTLPYHCIEHSESKWIYSRGDHSVVVNLNEEEIAMPEGKILLATQYGEGQVILPGHAAILLIR